jgi:hypothetical protein
VWPTVPGQRGLLYQGLQRRAQQRQAPGQTCAPVPSKSIGEEASVPLTLALGPQAVW